MKSSNKILLKIIVALTVFVAVFIVCVLFGSTGLSINFNDIFSDLTIFNVRLPRVIIVAIAGAILSVCGVAMQSMLKNPLADGTTVGVSSGASLGAVISIIISSQIPMLGNLMGQWATMIFAIAFALLSLMFILLLSNSIDRNISTNTIILIGVIFSLFCSALISLLIALFPENTQTITFWTMGSVVGVNYHQCIILGVTGFIGCVALFICAEPLDICSLGEVNAQSLGVNLRVYRIVVLVAVSAMIGICVSICGVIGFVGLAVPHICRFLVGAGNKKLMAFSVITGATFLMLSDLISRTIVIPKELPIGVITSIIGTIVFVIVFYKRSKVK